MRIKSFIYIALMAFLLSSCEFEMSNNGDLDGLWQMTEMQRYGNTLKEDELKIKDMRSEGILWAVNFNLLQTNSNAINYSVFFRFNKANGKLTLHGARIENFHEAERLINDVDSLKPFGVYNIKESFTIEELDSKSMILVSDSARLVFRHY